MFFEKDFLLFNFIDVIELKQNNVSIVNCGRNYSALSFRMHADAVLKTETDQFNIGDNCVTYVPSNVEYHRTANTDEMIAIHFETLNYRFETIEFFAPKDSNKFQKLFKEILVLRNNQEPGYKYACTALLYQIFAECFKENYSLPNKPKIANSVEYLSQHYTESELSIKEVAEKSFISEVYFRKLFKKEFGISPKKYIINLRIQNATRLILTGYYSLQEIAVMSGYNDYKYFSAEFKKSIGISPSKYSYDFHKKSKILTQKNEL